MRELKESSRKADELDFSSQGYKQLISRLKECKYAFDTYESWRHHKKSVILRHDVDVSLNKAVKLSNLEEELGVTSTYFVLVRSNFYNLLSPDSIGALLRIMSNGSEIGLHYDETLYNDTLHIQHIQKEADLLSALIGKPVTKVSMHRPSKATINEFWEIPGMINSYSREFFEEFKYVSDSRCQWHEPINEIIGDDRYPRLHLLTHPNWYDGIGGLEAKLQKFLNDSYCECYDNLNANFTDLGSVVSRPSM